MLLPIGAVVESGSGVIDIDIPSDADSTVDIACYDMHRRLKVFETETISARLQLAAVCALTGRNTPCKHLYMKRAEAVLQVLRGCRPSQPFLSEEKDCLLEILKLTYREQAVDILAAAWLAQADRLAFLYGQKAAVGRGLKSADEMTEYSDLVTGIICGLVFDTKRSLQ